MMEAYWLAVAVLPTEDVPRYGLPAVPSAVLPAGDLHWQEEQVVVMTATAPPVELDKAQAAVWRTPAVLGCCAGVRRLI